jgi:hypothetical protein
MLISTAVAACIVHRAGIFAVASSDNQPVNLLEKIRDPKALPRMFRRGHYDSNIFRQYVLVHDMQSTEDKALER